MKKFVDIPRNLCLITGMVSPYTSRFLSALVCKDIGRGMIVKRSKEVLIELFGSCSENQYRCKQRGNPGLGEQEIGLAPFNSARIVTPL
jgi:hypothetical protein